VVGRAHKGLDILHKLNEAAVDPDDLPLQPITVTGCGLTDSEVITDTCAMTHPERPGFDIICTVHGLTVTCRFPSGTRIDI